MLEYTPKPVSPFVKAGLFLVVLLVIIGLFKDWDTVFLLFLLFGYLFFYGIMWLRQKWMNWKQKKWILRFNEQEEQNRREEEARQREWEAYCNDKKQKLKEWVSTAGSMEELETCLSWLWLEENEELRKQLAQIYLENLSKREIQPRKVMHPVTKGRPCYYTGHARQVQRRKIEGQMRIDPYTAQSVTFFVFEKEFEWLSKGAHTKIVLSNIVDMDLDVDNQILELTQRSEKAVYFQGSNMPLLKYVIAYLQAKQMQSW